MDKYNIELKFKDTSYGGFYILDNGIRLAELEFYINDGVLDAYHTGVRKELEGHGVAGQLFNALVDYARKNNYRIKATCPYVLAKLSRDPDTFANVWFRDDGELTKGHRYG